MKKTILMSAVSIAVLGSSAITEKEIDKLVGEMTLEEKIGQLVQFGSAGAQTGGAESSDSSKGGLPADVVEWIRKGRVGSLIGACGVGKFNAFQKIAMTEQRLHIPLMVGNDMVHGCRTQWPISPMLACCWDERLWERCGRITAFETPSKGCNWTFAPMVDIARDPRWGRIAEGCGQDPLIASRMCAALVKGIQTKDNKYPIAACLKHYAGYGAATAGRDYFTVELDESTFRNVYLPPFAAGVKAGVMTVMPAFNTLNGVPCSVNRWLLTDVLRKELGFSGFLISDWNAIGECITGHGVAEGDVDASALSINAGMDQDMMSGCYQRGLKAAVERGLVEMRTVDACVRNILRVKNELGLFEHPYIDAKIAEAQVDFVKFGEIAREAAARSMVLLKNENATLPLKKGAKLLVVGPEWDNKWHWSGTWSSYGENDAHIFPLKEFKAAGLDFVYSQQYDFTKWLRTEESIRDEAAKADVIIAAFGEKGGESGEGWSKQRLELPAAQLEALDELKATGKPVVAILVGGRPRAIPELAEKADAILFVWSPGTSAGTALVDVLTGKVNPEGRLVVEMPYSTGQLPLYYNRLPSSRPTEKVGNCCSCYRDGPWTALYPFGYGLSYTSFAYANEEVKVEGEGEERSVVFSCDVTNTGKVAGTETVQAYTRDLVGVESRPIRELRGWQQLKLQPGETGHAKIVVPVKDLSYWVKSKLVPAEGAHHGWICRDSASGKPVKFTLK